jgi:hypothetical protein
MLKNRTFQMFLVIALIGIALASTISAANPTYPSKPDLSWPPRPDFFILNQMGIIPFTGDQGYAPRHSLNQKGIIPFAGDQGYAPRHR